MKAIQQLTELIAEFPGIGPRQARRIVQFLLAKDGSFRENIAELIEKIRNEVAQCSLCFRYDDSCLNDLCAVCRDPNRTATELMVVEKDVDIEGIEHSGAYRGRYFVLGGLMTMTNRKTSAIVRRAELLNRVQKNGIQEIIFALATTPEGDYTARELMREAKGLYPNIKITLLGRGLSIGAEIEYADSETLRSALKNRA